MKIKKTVVNFNDTTITPVTIINKLCERIGAEYYKIKFNPMSNRKIGPYPSIRMYIKCITAPYGTKHIKYTSILATKCNKSTYYRSKYAKYGVAEARYGKK